MDRLLKLKKNYFYKLIMMLANFKENFGSFFGDEN